MIQPLCRSSRKLQSLALGLAMLISLSAAAWCANPTLIAQPVVTAPASIPELARALKYDAVLIYEYVYSNIDYTPIYGVKKGALGALLDGHGNDFDQAALMVALLRQSGYTASYVSGKITLNQTQLSNLFGVDTSTACPVLRLLGQGGFPVSLTGCNVTSFNLNLAHVWVKATGGSLGATTYVFDPSFKTYTTQTPSINLASAMGYNQSSFLSLAESGATITGNSIQTVNSTNIHTALAGYAGNLVNYIKSNIPAATLKDVIGGKYIQPIAQPYTLITSLPYEMPGDTPQTWTGDIPNTYRTTMEITIGGIDVTYYADQIYGHRLSLVYDSSLRPVLYLDGVVQGTGTANAVTLNYNINFPFCFATAGSPSAICGSSGGVNFTNIFTAQNVVKAGIGYTYAIVNGWDFTGRGMLEFHRRQLQINQAAGGSVDSEAVLGETLNMIGYSWLAQLSGVNDLADRIIGTKTVTQCAVGVVGQVTGPYIDLPGLLLGLSSLTNDTNRPNTLFFTNGGNGSALEWGALDQNLSKQNIGAVSTIKLLDMANTSNLVIYDATSANWSTIQPLLSAYSPGDMNEIQNAYINNGYRVILPQRGDITQSSWTGVGYLATATDAAGNQSITYKISSNLKGGYTVSGIDPADFVQLIENTTPDLPKPTQFASFDPIDLSGGAYLYDHDDIAIGSDGFPYGLAFHRSYSSSNRYSPGPLGLGWTHNLAINAIVNSDGLKGMGQDSPIDGAAAIAAVYVMQDLFSDPAKPLAKVVIASLSQRWLMDQLINNTVIVTQGSQTEQFVRLADGSYNTQLGFTDRLSLSGGAYTLQNKDGATLNFNSAGNISTWNTPSGVNVSFAYNGAAPPQLVSVSNSLGRSLTLGYNGSNQIALVKDNAARSVSYAYDGSGNLSSFTDPMGSATRFSYSSPGLLGSAFYPSFPATPFVTNTYDTLGRVATQTNANGALWNYFFAGYRSEEVDPLGARRVLYYNPRGKAQFDIRDIAGLDLVTAMRYDGLDRLTSTTMPEGNNLAYTYSAVNAWANNIATVTRNKKPASPLPATVQSFTYELARNKVATASDALGRVTTYRYDGNGNLTQTVADAGAAPHLNATTTSAYDARGKVILTTGPTGTATQFQYDSFENVVSSVANYGTGSGYLNATARYAYDAAGNVVAKTDPNGNTTTMTYDAARRLLSTTAPINLAKTVNSYDADGRAISVTRVNPGADQVTQTSYTPTGKVRTVTDPNGNITTNAYDLNDRLQSVTRAQRTTSYSYDAVGRLAKVVDATGNAAEQYAYTANGKQASFTDARGNATTYTYDGFDRLTRTTFPIGSTGGHTSENVAYDANDNVVSRLTRALGTISFAYDTLNRRCTKTISSTPTACTATTSASPTVWFGYDLNGRATSMTDNSAAITAAVLPAPGTPVSYATTTSYDRLNRPVNVTWSPAPVSAVPAAASVTFAHAYNAANQRVRQTVTDNGWWFYPPATASTVNYTSNAANQYTAVGAVTPNYNGNGSPISDGTFSFGYDAENRLTSAIGSPNNTSYAYDAQGRRKTKTVNGTTTVIVTDADNRAVLEYAGSSGALLRWYAYGAGTNDILSQITLGGSRATMVPDIQGSVLAMLDSGTGAFTRQNYLPYGKSAGTSIAGTFGYTGQRIDPESGLYDYRARLYHAGWGRFLQPDPIGLAGGKNLYAYVGNDPLNNVDPSGLAADSSLQNFNQSFDFIGPAAGSNGLGFSNDAQNLTSGFQQNFSSSAQANQQGFVVLAAMSDIQRQRALGDKTLFGGEGGGGSGGSVSGSGSGGPSGAPASSFSGSKLNPLQAPEGPARNSPGEFNGITYSGHAFDQLQNRGISPSAADQAIRSGVPNPGNTPGTTRFYDPINNLSVVRDDATSTVITVRPGN